MENYDVVVLGSINLDVIVNVDQYPQYGDTVFANAITMTPGGKGANQVITVAKQGKKVLCLGSVGNDMAGKQMLENLQSYHIDTNHIEISQEKGTGIFVAEIDEHGENTMAGTLGANLTIGADYIQKNLENVEAKVLLLQMETSRESILEAMKIAKEKGMFVILDPAPADGYFEEALQYADVITPNQQETEKISGIVVKDQESALKAAQAIEKLGVKNSIIKMGSKGNLVYQSGTSHFVPSLKVKAVNTVGAGDTFAGALASHYVETDDLIKSVEYGNIVAGMKVSRSGGQESIPTYEEVLNYIKSSKKE